MPHGVEGLLVWLSLVEVVPALLRRPTTSEALEQHWHGRIELVESHEMRQHPSATDAEVAVWRPT